MGDWNSETSEVNTWMETQGLTNTRCDLPGYSNASVTYQLLKDFPIDGICLSYSLTANRGGFISFRILVGDQQYMWIEINKNRFLGFQQHEIILPMAHNLCLIDTRTIKRFNDKLHTSSLKNDIYQKMHYIYVRDSYPLPTHLSQSLEKLYKLIT